MLNCAIYRIEDGLIVNFIKNCTRTGGRFVGDNEQFGLRMDGLAVKWTEDEAVPTVEDHPAVDRSGNVMFTRKNIIGWTPATVDLLTEATTDRDIGIIDRANLIACLDDLRDMARITNQQIEDRLVLVTDLAKAKVYLQRLTQETRNVLRVVLWLLKDKL